ncbi:site-specific integrase [Sphingomonas sp. G-3-2-10]|uniref:tyrosine-type recombinase/integrase n=1 Tax=Sphingomonas sp. G-3-2-10 TaxID=2728838 RepID=UPI00146BA7F3|nr:site-specific integrase [Sphingomonas sp. G-3-2-10]NML06532.1 tyrosine-type recombinase/integrase [Sphingomonas sp. G-3-2-10]
MPTIELSAAAVQAIRATPRTKKETFFDEIITGFVLEARPDGGATYAVRYKDEYGRQKQYKIANAADLSFGDAKKEAIRIKSRTVVGQNPAEERKANRRIPTVSELSERYLEYAKTYKRSHDIDERYLRIHVVPRFGKLHLNQLDQTEIMDWLNGKVAAGYAQATVNRWQVILSHMLRMAKRWGLPGSDYNPLAGVKQKDPNNRIERYLSAAETKRLKQAVEESPNPMLKFIVALLLLTGCRKRELLDGKWEEVNLERKVWRIPTSKSGKPRHVPLSEDAIAVLKEVPRFDRCPYIVPNPMTRKPFTSIFHSWDSARRAAKLPDVRVHDLRHPAASNLVNSGQSLYVVAKVLGYSQTRTTERYAHLDDGVLLNAVNAASQVTGTTWATDLA